jgi:hypothetical protein
MVRRRKGEDPASMLLAAPWWASVALGSIGFAAMRWIVPSIFASSPLLAGLAALSRALAWLPLLVFGLIGAIAFARSKAIGESPKNIRGQWPRTYCRHRFPFAASRCAWPRRGRCRRGQASGPNQKWTANSTYVRTAEGWLFVAAVLDLYSQRVMDWSMHPGPRNWSWMHC